MKNLKRIRLQANTIEKEEMNKLLGGKIVYYCFRTQKNYDGSLTTFPFNDTNEAVANSWCSFWRSAGWAISMSAVDDGTGNGDSGPTPYQYA